MTMIIPWFNFSFSYWTISKLRIELCCPKSIDPYSPKRYRVQMSSSYTQHWQLYILIYVCTHILLTTTEATEASSPTLILASPTWYRGTLDSRWAKLELWEHCHNDCNTLKLCSFLKKEKVWAWLWWLGFSHYSSQVTRVQADDNSWKFLERTSVWKAACFLIMISRALYLATALPPPGHC